MNAWLKKGGIITWAGVLSLYNLKFVSLLYNINLYKYLKLRCSCLYKFIF